MADRFVERNETPVLRVLADFRGPGPSAAFRALEARLPTLRGRHFFGEFRWTPSGPVYHACVERIAADDPKSMGLEEGTLAGGLYAGRRIPDWKKRVAELPKIAEELIGLYELDRSRPTLEHYRSRSEMEMLLPILSRSKR